VFARTEALSGDALADLFFAVISIYRANGSGRLIPPRPRQSAS
jgi:hypothetical protein